MSISYAYESRFACNVCLSGRWEKLCEACWKLGDRDEKDLGQDRGYIVFIELGRRMTLVGEAVHKRCAIFTSLLFFRNFPCPTPFGKDRELITRAAALGRGGDGRGDGGVAAAGTFGGGRGAGRGGREVEGTTGAVPECVSGTVLVIAFRGGRQAGPRGRGAVGGARSAALAAVEWAGLRFASGTQR